MSFVEVYTINKRMLEKDLELLLKGIIIQSTFFMSTVKNITIGVNAKEDKCTSAQ